MIETTNLNVEIDKELSNTLKIMALKKGLDYHNFIRIKLQEIAYGRKHNKKNN